MSKKKRIMNGFELEALIYERTAERPEKNRKGKSKKGKSLK